MGRLNVLKIFKNHLIGNFVHIYGHAYLAHDSIIQDYCTLTAHSIIGARVVVDEGAHIGVNASIREDVKIGKYAIIGMGAVVINDVNSFEVVAGNPAKSLGHVSDYSSHKKKNMLPIFENFFK